MKTKEAIQVVRNLENDLNNYRVAIDYLRFGGVGITDDEYELLSNVYGKICETLDLL